MSVTVRQATPTAGSQPAQASADWQIPFSRSDIFEGGEGELLFVPTEDMWLVREASAPCAVADRAGISRANWSKWKAELSGRYPWLLGWLYHNPRHIPAGNEGFEPTPAMRAFRRQSRITAVANATRRQAQPGRRRFRGHVSRRLIRSWLMKFKSYGWVKDWLFGAAALPDGVTAVSTAQRARCRQAWDYWALCRAAGMHAGGSYCRWILDGRIPDLAWLWWLYGRPAPRDVFRVEPPLQRLRMEKTREAILAAAAERCGGTSGGLKHHFRQWQQDAGLKKALLQAIDAAAANPRQAWPASRPDLERDTAERMWAYALAAQLTACCERASLSRSAYDDFRRAARRVGVLPHLMDYLEQRGGYGKAKSALCGLVAPGFFIESANMLAFRAKAAAEMTAQNITALTRLPAFDRWFLAWALPKAEGGGHDRLVRTFLPGPNAAAPSGAEPAARKAKEETSGGGASVGKPRWDDARGELSYGGRLIRRYEREGTNQRTLLRAFQASRWPRNIASPLGAETLSQTVRDLNRIMKESPLKFGQDDKGKRATWRLR